MLSRALTDNVTHDGKVRIYNGSNSELDGTIIHEGSHLNDIKAGTFHTDMDDPNLRGYNIEGHKNFSKAWTVEERYIQDRYAAEGAIIRGDFSWPR